LKYNSENTYLTLPKLFFQKTLPEQVSDPKIAVWNESLAKELGFQNITKKEQEKYFSGNEIFKNSSPIAQAYAGHQFGHFTILGDGRAIVLGEQITLAGNRIDVQLKGSGRTPYSRSGDGRATLYSMLREYLISESMHGLGIPTSRSLSVVSTGNPVYRQTVQKGAVLTRISASHIRIGTFEYAARTQSIKEVKALADYSINRHYPELLKNKNPYLSFFKKVVEQQIKTVVNWLRVGFIHGVMNTDNITISGETIDYGPCAFMNTYDPNTVFSSIDTQKRYAFGNQGRILLWNLARLAETLLPLFDDKEESALSLAQVVIDNYESQYQKAFTQMMRGKLGFEGEQESDEKLIAEFLQWMKNANADYTNTFLSLESELLNRESTIKFTIQQFDEKTTNQLNTLLAKWKLRVGKNTDNALELMQGANPRVIPRNHLVEKALNSAANDGDYTQFHDLLKVTTNPYVNDTTASNFQVPPTNDGSYQTFCGT